MFQLCKEEKSIFFCYKCILLLITLFLSIESYYTISAKDVLETSARIIKLADQLRCPTCQGLSVKDSESGFSKIFRVKILKLIKE